MARLIYSGITSLDGFVADPDGNFDWSMPDEEVHAFVNDLERSIGTYLLGRRMHEVLRFWDTAHTVVGLSPVEREFTELWQAADKVVYSTTLEEVSGPRTRLERKFDPEAVRRLKAAGDRDLSVGGPDLAAQMIRAGLVDEFHLFVSPVMVGGGHSYFPPGVRLPLELLAERRFDNGVMYLRYQLA